MWATGYTPGKDEYSITFKLKLMSTHQTDAWSKVETTVFYCL